MGNINKCKANLGDPVRPVTGVVLCRTTLAVSTGPWWSLKDFDEPGNDVNHMPRPRQSPLNTN